MNAIGLPGRHQVRSLWQPLTRTTRFGLALAGVGVVADFIHHGFTHDMHAVAVLNIGAAGHVLTLAGMVLAMTGVIHAAAAQSRRRTRKEGERNAARSRSAAAR